MPSTPSVELSKKDRAQDQSNGDRANKRTGSLSERVHRSAAAQRIDAPGQASQGHETCAQRWGSGDAGEDKVYEAHQGQAEPKPLGGEGPFTRPKSAGHHRDLYGTEENQRSGSGAQADVCEGEGHGVEGEHGG